MSESLDDRTLDTVIDEVAYSLTATEGPAGLQDRVLARIRSAERKPRVVRWLVPAAAMGAICLAVLIVWRGTPLDVPPDRQAAGASNTNETVGSGSRSDGSNSMGSGFSRSDDVAEVRLKPDTTNTERTVLIDDPPAGIESIESSPLSIAAVENDALTSIVEMSVEAIPMESLEVSALGAQ